jgi:gas vesicle protein
MTVTQRRIPPEELDLEAEQEVDFRRYWNAVIARWWLPVLGLGLGLLAGYALALGGGDVYKARSTIYLGQPFTPNGAAPVPGLATNPSTVNEIVRNEGALEQASEVSGMNLAKLRRNISTKTIRTPAGARALPAQTPLYEITVTGSRRAPTQRAANSLSQTVVEDVSPYVEDKISAIEERITSDQRELTSIDRRQVIAQRELNALIGDRSLSTAERLIGITNLNSTIAFGEQRRGVVQADLLEAKQALSLAQNVERPSIVERAVAQKTTARSVGRSVLVGGLIGLILGVLAAILWEPARRRFATA